MGFDRFAFTLTQNSCITWLQPHRTEHHWQNTTPTWLGKLVLTDMVLQISWLPIHAAHRWHRTYWVFNKLIFTILKQDRQMCSPGPLPRGWSLSSSPGTCQMTWQSPALPLHSHHKDYTCHLQTEVTGITMNRKCLFIKIMWKVSVHLQEWHTLPCWLLNDTVLQ